MRDLVVLMRGLMIWSIRSRSQMNVSVGLDGDESDGLVVDRLFPNINKTRDIRMLFSRFGL